MTEEQFAQAYEIKRKLKILKDEDIMRMEITPRHLPYTAKDENGYVRDSSCSAGDQFMKDSGQVEWLNDQLQEIIDRLKARVEKRIIALEKELKSI